MVTQALMDADGQLSLDMFMATKIASKGEKIMSLLSREDQVLPSSLSWFGDDR